MKNAEQFIVKHKMIFLVLGALIVAYILYKLFANRGSTATSTTPVQTSSGIPVSAVPSGPSNYAPVTNTTTSTSTVQNTSTSDVYSPYDSSYYSTQSSMVSNNALSTVDSHNLQTSSSVVDSHNQANTYNNQQYGLQNPPTGFAGVAGVSSSPMQAQQAILPYQPWTPAFQQAAVNAIAAAKQAPVAVTVPSVGSSPLGSYGPQYASTTPLVITPKAGNSSSFSTSYAPGY